MVDCRVVRAVVYHPAPPRRRDKDRRGGHRVVLPETSLQLLPGDPLHPAQLHLGPEVLHEPGSLLLGAPVVGSLLHRRGDRALIEAPPRELLVDLRGPRHVVEHPCGDAIPELRVDGKIRIPRRLEEVVHQVEPDGLSLGLLEEARRP